MAPRVRYYTDEHVSGAVVMGLRRRGVSVLTAQEAGMMGASDEEHFAVARQRGLVMFTSDADFLRLHSRGMAHNGIVYARQRTPVGAIIRGLMLIHQVLDAADMENHVEFL
jgi:hypothetical protein